MLELFTTARRCAAILLLCVAAPCVAQDAAQSRRPVTLDDLYSEVDIVDTAISTSGRYLAVILRRDGYDNLMLVDFDTDERKIIQRVGVGEAGEGLAIHMVTVYWKSDDRMLLRTRVLPGIVAFALPPCSMSCSISARTASLALSCSYQSVTRAYRSQQ